MTARPLHELVEAGWATALEPVGAQVTQMGEFLRAEIAAGHRYLPAGPNVLRAFTFPFDQVRVLKRYGLPPAVLTNATGLTPQRIDAILDGTPPE